jgi:predicted helicase
VKYDVQPALVRSSLYRPFVKKHLLFDKRLNEMQYQLETLFPASTSNRAFVFSDSSARSGFSVLALDSPPEYHLAASTDGFQCVAIDRFESGHRIDNITDWSLAQFKKHYQPGSGKKAKPITKDAIFHYVYAVLHDPQYREKYAQNLKREFPRIPLYGDSEAAFWQWAGWGERLMALHIGYESVEPFALKRSDVPDAKALAAGQSPKPALKSDKDVGLITLDSETTLAGVPPEAWRYQLGNRCAIDWVLDQYKEKKPKDPTIRAMFDTYRFADHKEKVIDLLTRVTTVSVETMKIVDAMRSATR